MDEDFFVKSFTCEFFEVFGSFRGIDFIEIDHHLSEIFIFTELE